MAKNKNYYVSQSTKGSSMIDTKTNNIELEPITDFNFLGIIINKHLRWKSHINKISINIARTTGILRSLNQVLPGNVLLTI